MWPFLRPRSSRACFRRSRAPTGLVLRLVLLAAANAIGLWALVALLGDDKWVAAVCVLLATLAIDLVYLTPIRGLIPLKFLVPGTVFLIAFQLIPIIYNSTIAFTNWSTGHNLTKEEAIATIQETSLAQPPDGSFYAMTPARVDGTLALLLVEEGTGATFAGTEEGLEPLAPADAPSTGGVITAADGYDVLTGNELVGIDRELAELVVPAGGDSFVRAEGLSTALELEPTLRYDEQADTFTNIETGVVFEDNGKGSYANAQGEQIEQGWRTNIGFENFEEIFTNPLIRDPFLSTFAWTFVYAGLSVLLTFFAGLFIAIALNHEALRFQRVQRSILILPYAIPAFLSILVWRGLLNDDFGVVNNILPRRHPVAVRPVLGQGLVPARQLLARDPLHVPRLHGRAPVDPRRAHRGGAGRRRVRAPGLSEDHAAAAARRRRAAPDRVVRVQLQQLQRRSTSSPRAARTARTRRSPARPTSS